MKLMDYLKEKTEFIYYNSLDELTTSLKTADLSFRPQSYISDLKSAGHARFAGASQEKALELLKYGWEQQAEKLTLSAKTRLEPSLKQSLKYDVHGFIPSTARYLQGLPTSMVNIHNKKAPAPAVNIYVNLSTPASVSATALFDRAVEIVKVVNAFENKGYGVNIYSLVYTQGYSDSNYKYYTWMCKIKGSNEKFHIKKIAFACSHPAMLRQIFFLSVLGNKTFSDRYLDGYGQVKKLYDIREKFEPNDIMIDGVDFNAQKFIEKSLYFNK